MLGVGFLDNVKLHSAREGGGITPALTVEQCTCPDGYVGQFCESCAPGYRRDPPGTSPLSRCIPCNCNKHSDACDVRTGAPTFGMCGTRIIIIIIIRFVKRQNVKRLPWR